MRAPTNFSLLLLPLMLTGCTKTATVVVPAETPRPVSLEVEVYDPATNLVWQGVSVRVVAGTMEWSGVTIPSASVAWLVSDSAGLVLFDEYALASAGIGFVEDQLGRAMLEPDLDRDDAVVEIEISAPGFVTVRAQVPLSWEDPDQFASVPFTAES